MGDLHTEVQHEQSGVRLQTDSPVDHAGKGENFAPTDLLATALGTCFLTVMGITAKERGWRLDEISVEIEKKMTAHGPRKIESLGFKIEMPSNLNTHQLKILKESIKDCPVLRNLNNSLKIKLHWCQVKKKSKVYLNFIPTNVFRETPQVKFFDAGIKESNGSDVVIHHVSAVSPPNDENFEQYYDHHHQIDQNLVLQGTRAFTLLNPEWDEPHHVIYLNQRMGALQIPAGTFHQSASGLEGSIVLNQAVRESNFGPRKEFTPISLRNREDLRKAKAADPIF